MPCYMRMYVYVYVWMCAFSFSGEIDSRVVEVTNYGAPCRTPRFFAKLKIEPPNFFRQCFFFNNNFCTPDYFVETKNVGHHRERDDRSHLTSHSNTAVRCNIERGFPYTDTRQLDRSFTAAHQVTSLLICCINYTKNFTVIFLCETTEVAESWESSHERRQPSI